MKAFETLKRFYTDLAQKLNNTIVLSSNMDKRIKELELEVKSLKQDQANDKAVIASYAKTMLSLEKDTTNAHEQLKTFGDCVESLVKNLEAQRLAALNPDLWETETELRVTALEEQLRNESTINNATLNELRKHVNELEQEVTALNKTLIGVKDTLPVQLNIDLKVLQDQLVQQLSNINQTLGQGTLKTKS